MKESPWAEVEGISLGRSEGLREGLMSAARKMLALGSEVAFVQKATGLSLEEIEKLKEALKEEEICSSVACDGKFRI